jgi:hypothetical protein
LKKLCKFWKKKFKNYYNFTVKTLKKNFIGQKNTQRTMGNAPTTEQVYEINMAQMAVDLYNIWSKFDFIIKIQEPWHNFPLEKIFQDYVEIL